MRNRNRWTIEVSAMVLAAAVAVSTGGMTAEAASVDALEEAAATAVPKAVSAAASTDSTASSGDNSWTAQLTGTDTSNGTSGGTSDGTGESAGTAGSAVSGSTSAGSSAYSASSLPSGTTVSSGGTGVTSTAGQAFTVTVTAQDGGVYLRQGPGTRYNKALDAMIPTGTILQIMSTERAEDTGNLWGQTTYQGISGYIALSQTTRGNTTEEQHTAITGTTVADRSDYYVTVSAADGVNLRNGAGFNNELMLSSPIPTGTVLHIETVQEAPEGGKWGYTAYNNQNGWIALSQTEEMPESMDYGGLFTVVDSEGNPVALANGPDEPGDSGIENSSEGSDMTGDEAQAPETSTEAITAEDASESSTEAVTVASTEGATIGATEGSTGKKGLPGILEKLPIIPIVGGVAGAVVVLLLLLILKKKKAKAAGGAEGAPGAEGAAEGAPAKGGKPKKKLFAKKPKAPKKKK